jgi:hypothetical protein
MMSLEAGESLNQNRVLILKGFAYNLEELFLKSLICFLIIMLCVCRWLLMLFVSSPPSHHILRIALPQLDGFVVFKGGRCDDILGWMAGGTKDGVGVSLQALDDLLRLEVPDVHHVVFAAGDDPLEKCRKFVTQSSQSL